MRGTIDGKKSLHKCNAAGSILDCARLFAQEGEMLTEAADEIGGLRNVLSKLGYDVEGREFAAMLIGAKPEMH